MKTTTNISVVIPTADRAELLQRALKSVRDQSVTPDKIVIVDNGINAVDTVLEDEMVTVLRTKPILGPGKARNTGAQVCNSFFIAFLDDDDYWDSAYLENCLKRFQQSNADVVVGSLYKQSFGQAIKKYKMFPETRDEQRGLFYKNPGFGGINFVIKKDVFFEIGQFDENMLSTEDKDLAVRLLIAGRRIVCEPCAIAVVGERNDPGTQRHRIKGNLLFIRKHWRHMFLREKYRALMSVYRQCLETIKR